MKWSGTIIEIYRFQQRLCCVQNLHFRMKDPVQAGSWNGTQTIDKYLTRKMSRKECKVGGGGLSRQQCQISISQSPAPLSRKSPESAVATIAMSRGKGDANTSGVWKSRFARDFISLPRHFAIVVRHKNSLRASRHHCSTCHEWSCRVGNSASHELWGHR